MGRHRRDSSDSPTPTSTATPSRGHRHPRRRGTAARGSLLGASAAMAVGAAAVVSGLLPTPSGSPGGAGDDTTGLSRADGPPSAPAADGEATALTGPGEGTSPAPSGEPASSGSPSAHPSPTRTAARPTTRVSTAATKPAATRTAPAVATGGLTGAAAEVLTLVDQQRSLAGCGPLSPDPRLTELAGDFSDEMAARGFFDHTDPDGRTPWDRAAALGIRNLGGENIAEGQPDARAVMDAWMNSPGHRANILDCSYHTIGIGLHEPTASQTGGPWWTQDFGY